MNAQKVIWQFCAKGPFDLLKLPELGLRVAAFCFRRVMLTAL
jgi:hypothetical protein